MRQRTATYVIKSDGVETAWIRGWCNWDRPRKIVNGRARLFTNGFLNTRRNESIGRVVPLTGRRIGFVLWSKRINTV